VRFHPTLIGASADVEILRMHGIPDDLLRHGEEMWLVDDERLACSEKAGGMRPRGATLATRSPTR
jgi:hypothetical protein